MIRRFRDQNGDYCLRVKLGDLPAYNLGDERFVIGFGGVTLGLATGAGVASVIARGRIGLLRRHLIAARNEVESTRKISQNDVRLAKQFGTTSVFKDLLPTCDNIDRALSASASISSCDGDSKGSSLRSGLELTRKELLKVLQKHGVAPLDVTEGDVFSPDLCEAMLAQPLPALVNIGCEDEEDTNRNDDISKQKDTTRATGPVTTSSSSEAVAGTISGVFLKGYSMHGRVIRPAQVGVYRDHEV